MVNQDTSWIESDPLQKNLARVIRDQVQALNALANQVNKEQEGLKGNERTRLIRTEMAIRSTAASVAMKAMAQDVGSTLQEAGELTEA